MKGLILLLVQLVILILCDVFILSAASGQACVVSNSSEINPWRWKEVLLTFWVPPRSSAEVVFGFQTTRTWKEKNSTISKYNWLFNNKTYIKTISSGTKSYMLSEWTGHKWKRDRDEGGWVQLVFEERQLQFSFRKPGSSESLSNFSKGTKVDSVIFTGNNMSIDCVSGRLLWSITDSKVIVPLDANLKIWKFGIYPVNQFDLWPILTLGNVNISMEWNGWKNSIEVTRGYSPFESYVLHLFQIECSSSSPSTPPKEANVTCYLKNDSRVVMVMNLASWPTYLEVWNDENAQFFFHHDILSSNNSVVLEDRPFKPKTALLSDVDDVGNKANSVSPGWSGWWPALTIISTFLLILVIALFIVSHRDRQKFDSLVRPILPDGFTRCS